MKKIHLTYAGIAAAGILIVMFAAILLTGSFSIFAPVTIDPVPDHAPGDLVVITGTTSHMAGTVLSLDVIADKPSPGMDPRAGRADAFIVRGAGGANTWSARLDTSAMSPGEYHVNVYWVNETVRSGLLATTQLRLAGTRTAVTPAPVTTTPAVTSPGRTPVAGNDSTCQAIRIDAFPDRWTNNTFTITGTTSFPPGTALLVKVFPSEYDLAMNPGEKHPASAMSGAMGKVTVEKGAGSVNLWSVTLGKAQMEPGKLNYFVNVSNDGYDEKTFEPVAGDTFCVRRLVLPV